MLPLVVRPALLELTGAVPGSPSFQMWVGRLFYIPAVCGGFFGLLGGYLTDLFGRRRVLDIQHIDLCGRGVLVGVLHLGRYAAAAALLRVRGRLRGVRRRGRLAGGAVSRAASAREGARLHAGLLVVRRPAHRHGERSLRGVHRKLSRDRRLRPGRRHRGSARPLAVHADVGCAAGDSADPRQALSSRIASVAAEEGRGHARAPEHRGAVLTRAAPHDDRDDVDVCDGIRRHLWRAAAGSPDRSRSFRRARADRGGPAGASRSDQSAGRCRASSRCRRWAGWWGGSFSPTSRS